MRAYEKGEGRRSGSDKFGTFRITGGPCTNCGLYMPSMCIHYRRGVDLPEGIKPEDTILRNPEDTYLGINCGCYAKLHRQVVHIQERMKMPKTG